MQLPSFFKCADLTPQPWDTQIEYVLLTEREREGMHPLNMLDSFRHAATAGDLLVRCHAWKVRQGFSGSAGSSETASAGGPWA